MKFRYAILLLLVLAAIVWLFPDMETESSSKESRQDFTPEFTANGLKQSLYDQNGKLYQEVIAEQMEHYSELQLTYFKNPTFTIYQDDKAYWNISALEGNIQNSLLTLDSDVTMIQLDQNKLVQTISTQYLEIDLESNTVMTDNDIQIEGKKITIKGNGLFVDLDQGNVSLTNHVETIIKRS